MLNCSFSLKRVPHLDQAEETGVWRNYFGFFAGIKRADEASFVEFCSFFR